MKFKISNPLNKLSAVVVASFYAGQVQAQQDLSSISTTLSGNIFSAGDLISNGAYVAGSAFVVSGLVHLKKTAENPGQHQAYAGAGKIAIGGALVTAPAFVNYAINSLSTGAENQGTGVSNGFTNRFSTGG